MKTPPFALDPQSRAWSLLAAAACLLPLLLQLLPVLGIGIGATAVLVAMASWRQPLPVALRWLLPVVLVAGVLWFAHFRLGRDAGCALLAAMLAIKPAETSSLRDGRSLLGFALFAPFATFLLDQGPLSLVLGLAGTSLALAALLRLTELETGDGRYPLPPWQRLVSVMKLMVIGLPLALAVFWLFPRIATPLWGVPERSMARPGLSDRMSPGEWIDLLNDDTVALRVRFLGRTPPTSRMYWRGPVLWTFDGRTWSQPEWLRSGGTPARANADTGWQYEMDVEPTDARQLVALEFPTSVPAGTQLSLDGSLYSDQPLSAVTRWRLDASGFPAAQPLLPRALRAMALQLPPGLNPRTVALGRQWRRDAGNDDAAIVQRAMDMIRKDFAYTLATPLPGRNGVDEFLFDEKAGFCEHFSSAFVVLMRAAGIPSRVVTGYVGGYENPIGHYWQVRRSDAHAWAEVWMVGRGWVREDPTAAVAPERIFDTLADRAPGAGGVFGSLVPSSMFNLGDWLHHGWNDFALGFNAQRQQELLRALGMDGGSGGLVALFMAAAMLALAWMAWLTARAERERDRVLRAWHRLGARYARRGLARESHEPAMHWAERVSSAQPSGAHQLRELSVRFNNWRYAANQARSDAAALVHALQRHRPGE